MAHAMTQKDIQRVASNLSSWLQSAMYDLAAGQCAMASRPCDEFGEYTQAEAEAERLYDDAGTIRDILGDRIHDEGKGDYATMIRISEQMKTSSHTALTKACDSMITDWKRWKEREQS